MNGYVAAGYGVTLLGLAGYAVHVLHRKRGLRARAGGDRSQSTSGARR